MSIALFKKIVLGILGLIGVSIILLLTIPHGAGILPDSVAYISVARNLTEGSGFVTFEGTSFVLQPPLYPLLLASIKELLSIDPIITAGYLNAILFGLIVYLTGLFFLKHLKSFTLVFFGTVSVLISYAIVQASLMAMSETLFIFLVLLFLYYFEKYQSKPDLVSLLILSVSAALACLTRYTSVIIIITGIICIFLWSKKNNKEKFWHSLIFMFIPILPVSFWIIRNYFLSGTLVGYRSASSYTLSQNFGFFYDTVIHWYLPINLRGIYFFFIFLIVAIWILFGFKSVKSLNRERLKLIGPSLLFVLFYAGIILISSTTTAFDRVSDRLLSPIYIPLIFIIFIIFDKIISWLSNFFNPKLITFLFIISFVMLMSSQFNNTIHIIEEYNAQSGWEYSADSWRKSETIDYLKKHKYLGKSYKLYSNEPEAVYILTNLKTKRSPVKTYYNSPKLFKIFPRQNDIWINGDSLCLIWFDKSNRNFLFTIDELQNNIDMKEVSHLKDGEIYTFSIK